MLTRHLLDIILPETGLAGGLTECKKIMDMAYAFRRRVHAAWLRLGRRHGGHAVHLAAAMPYQPSPTRPDLLPFEYAPEPFSRLGDLLSQPFEFHNGVLQVPLDRPGLGIELDRGALKTAPPGITK